MSGISSVGGWDGICLDIASELTEPHCYAFSKLRYRIGMLPLDPGKFDNASTKTKEIAIRIFEGIVAIVLCTAGLPLLIAMGALSKVFKAIGFALQKDNCTHIVTGTPPRSINGLPKIYTKNLCGIGGGMHYDHGGVNNSKSRLQALVQKIRNEDADVVVLQEVYDAKLLKALVKELSGEFCDIYTNMGQSTWGSVGGLMVLSKVAVHNFTNEDFNNSTWQLKRGFATIEVKQRPEDALPCARVIGTHLIHDSAEERMGQVAQIVDSLARRSLSLPTVLTGDLNIERDGPEEAVLRPYLKHGYRGADPTCTGRLSAQATGRPAEPDETIDYISLFKRVVLQDGRTLPVVEEGIDLVDCHLVPGFDATYNTRAADSDHQGMGARMVRVVAPPAA